MSTASQQWGWGEEGKVGRAMLWKDGGSSCQALPAPLSALISLPKGSVGDQDAKSGSPVKDILAGLGSNLGKQQIKSLLYFIFSAMGFCLQYHTSDQKFISLPLDICLEIRLICQI